MLAVSILCLASVALADDFKTIDGKEYKNAKVSRVEPDGLDGTPVPGQSGLVTSPFAPDRGYVDVTGFSPGTEVEDPYTGKIFLTP